MASVPTPKCQWCGGAPHGRLCPLISAIEYFDDGVLVKRVEFHNPFTRSSSSPKITVDLPATLISQIAKE